MRKVHLVSSLLMAFTASLFGLGCDSGKPNNTVAPPSPATTSPSTTTGAAPTNPASTSEAGNTPAPAASTEKTAEAKPKKKPSTSRPKKSSSSGSTTGAGIDEVPGGSGTKEKPKSDENK